MSSANENSVAKRGDGHDGTKHNLGRDFKDLGQATSHVASEAAHMAKENASEYYDMGIKQAKIFEKSIENRIQTHPLQSLLIVAGVGLVMGALWNRR